ncbi:MAG: hypothetical protein Kow0098_15800 [Ignavibacteriaceae bacterium]
MKIQISALIIVLSLTEVFSQVPEMIRINEFLYDGIQSEGNEFVEVVVPENFTELHLIHVYLYDGQSGEFYQANSLDEFIPGATDDGLDYYYFLYETGLQNGSPDGIALTYNEQVVNNSFISYEGVFTASNGPAAGLISTDIGVETDSITPAGFGISLTGQGIYPDEFSWTDTLIATPGFPNGNTFIPAELNYFRADVDNFIVHLEWETVIEVNSLGFEIERFDDQWHKIGFREGSGTTNSPVQYSFDDSLAVPGITYAYRLKQLDTRGFFTYFEAIQITVPSIEEFTLSQNYPNPFNNETILEYRIPFKSNVTLSVYDITGRKVKIVDTGEKSAGIHRVKWNAGNLASGTYFAQLKYSGGSKMIKLLLLK